MQMPLSRSLRGIVGTLSSSLTMLCLLLPILIKIGSSFALQNRSLLAEVGQKSSYQNVIAHITAHISSEISCMMAVSDRYYSDVFSGTFYSNLSGVPSFKVEVTDFEDLLSPTYKTLSVLQESQKQGCNTNLILLANPKQTLRLLKFIDRNRIIDSRSKYILVFDSRLFIEEMHYIWKKIINVIFIRKYSNAEWYQLLTVPFPSPQVISPKRISFWQNGVFQPETDFFLDKTSDLLNQTLRAVTFPHMPSAVRGSDPFQNQDKSLSDAMFSGYTGVEVKMLQSLSVAMNFSVLIYETTDAELEAWGRQTPNGAYTGLYGEVESGRADFALGNFHYTAYNLKILDLSLPYTTQCFTFLTPASKAYVSWKTLILPFKLDMWLAILLTLFAGGFLFHALARFHKFMEHHMVDKSEPQAFKPKVLGLHLFENLENSILYTFGMLLLVALPRMPSGWALRLLAGWWWMYCLLVVVAFRASMTAILANPAPKVTINTLEQLAESHVKCGGWGEQNKEFFTTSLDKAGRDVGRKFRIVYDADSVIDEISEGSFAYYENIYFLRIAKVKSIQGYYSSNKSQESHSESALDRKHELHVMDQCVINLPISLGLKKNSPLKPRVDIFIQRVVEAGLVKKWLTDVMLKTEAAEEPIDTHEVKAFMDMRKLMGGVVGMAIGYSLGLLALIGEKLHWHLVVMKHPLFNKYDLSAYYGRKIVKSES